MDWPGLLHGLYDRWWHVVTGMRGNLVGRSLQGVVGGIALVGECPEYCNVLLFRGLVLRNYGIYYVNSKLNFTKLVMDLKRFPSKKP